MHKAAALSGLSVLVVDDRFLLADEARLALEAAGAEVLGPCPNEASALQLLDRRTPSCAVLDINLEGGPAYVVARALRAKGIPLVFLSGYDRAVLPPEFAAAACLSKPADYERVIEEVARASAPSP